MKLNVMFTIAAIVLILTGILALIVPGNLLQTTDITAVFNARLSAAAWLSLGVIAWLVRNAEASKARDAVVFGFTLLFALWAVVSLYGFFLVDMPSHSISWIAAVIQALIAIGFFVAGRAAMSGSAS